VMVNPVSWWWHHVEVNSISNISKILNLSTFQTEWLLSGPCPYRYTCQQEMFHLIKSVKTIELNFSVIWNNDHINKKFISYLYITISSCILVLWHKFQTFLLLVICLIYCFWSLSSTELYSPRLRIVETWQ
jgi:thiosulfate reductase cytochrome b subunit